MKLLNGIYVLKTFNMIKTLEDLNGSMRNYKVNMKYLNSQEMLTVLYQHKEHYGG